MEIVCAPETYRRFESSSLRQMKQGYVNNISLFYFYSEYRRGFEGRRLFAKAKRFALAGLINDILNGKLDN